MYRATVVLSIRKPTFASSCAIRRRLQCGFSVAIRPISSTISALIGGRPIRLDFHVQKRANPRRGHPTTVSGFTIARVSAHLDQTRESKTQKARSLERTRGLFVRRRNTASCCRSSRFSAMRFALGWKADRSAPTIAMNRSITPYARPNRGDCQWRNGTLAAVCCRRRGVLDGRDFSTNSLFTTTTYDRPRYDRPRGSLRSNERRSGSRRSNERRPGSGSRSHERRSGSRARDLPRVGELRFHTL